MTDIGLILIVVLLVPALLLTYMLGRGKDEPPAGRDSFEALRSGVLAQRQHLELDRLRTPIYTANCLIWALTVLAGRRKRTLRTRKRKRFRGYLVMRPSISRWRVTIFGKPFEGRIPHFLVQTSGRHKHLFSFVPVVRPAHPSLFYISLFQGRMVWGDQHAPEQPEPITTHRFPMLRAFALCGLLFVMLVLWATWWLVRIVRGTWWLIEWGWVELFGAL